MKTKRGNMKKKGIALSEIFIMVMATVAIAFILQQSFGLVSAQADNVNPGTLDTSAKTIPGNTPTGKPFGSFSIGQTGPGGSVVSSVTPPAQGANVNPSKSGSVTSYLANGKVDTSAVTNNIFKPKNGGYIDYTTSGGTAYSGIYGFKKEGDNVILLDKSNNPMQTLTGDEAKDFNNKASDKFKGTVAPGAKGIGAGLMEGVGWAVAVGGLTYLLAGAFGAKENMKLALTASLAVGVLAYKSMTTLTDNGKLGGAGSFWGGTGAIVVGLAAAALVFFLLYKEEEQRVVNFECQPYQPPLGGSQCEECNKYPFKPCSEYRCKSLGQACELLNAGTGSESCAWVSKFDVKSPIISTLDVLYPTNLIYNPDTSRPSGLGSKIVRIGGANNCLPAYAPLKFGITTNEPSQCKIDYVHTSSFKNMTFMFGESSLFLYNHTQQMKLPAPETSTNQSGSPLLKNDGTYSLYVRCQDANGNENVDEYTFGFCVDKSPDTTPPVVQASSIVSGSPVQFNVSNVPIQVYTNEPATCKWSRTNKDYIDMENNMSCSNVLMKVNSDLVYPCSSNLTSIKNKEDNNFYFRCKDQPNKPEKDRNVMAQSYTLNIKGSQPLNILRAGPNETIYGSTDITVVNLTIETDDGADEGAAWCSYSPTGAQNSYVLMYETNNSFMHKQQLDLASGDYTYYYRCIDNAGNRAETNVTFNVFVDRAMPQVTRAYKEMPDALKIVTNEDAQCAYSLTSCNFNYSDGKAMIYNPPEIKNVLLAEWKDNNVYYIKCMDFYGNEPSPNQCNVVISAARLSGGN